MIRTTLNNVNHLGQTTMSLKSTTDASTVRIYELKFPLSLSTATSTVN